MPNFRNCSGCSTGYCENTKKKNEETYQHHIGNYQYDTQFIFNNINHVSIKVHEYTLSIVFILSFVSNIPMEEVNIDYFCKINHLPALILATLSLHFPGHQYPPMRLRVLPLLSLSGHLGCSCSMPTEIKQRHLLYCNATNLKNTTENNIHTPYLSLQSWLYFLPTSDFAVDFRKGLYIFKACQSADNIILTMSWHFFVNKCQIA